MEEELDYSLTDSLFRISANGHKEPVFEMPAAHWLLTEQAQKALAVIGEMTRSIGLDLPASLAGLSLFNLCTAKLIILARHDCFVDLSLPNLIFQVHVHNGHSYAGYRIVAPERRESREANNEQFAKSHWTEFFREHINPAIESIARTAVVDAGLIWNQFGGQLANIREYLRRQQDYIIAMDEFDRCAAVLTERLSADVFGRKKNPFAYRPRVIDNPWQPGGRMIIRSSCCMFDRRVDGQKCYNCPRLSRDERESRRKVIADQTVVR
ncbi:(2Fe-2S)-binding protein [Paenibacillus xerothermodurans]|uniref:Ferric siderophore reductase C-terminal domain-containing protein n=1 Tax=Paenibacillus xerothermodurans TaxID=1977292 RepID=A0A2W1NRV4_PAEXE|nr:(2Fe-2S)-binding protein [Paenibacillus xerothermodurans]PZE22285.1 hypothetical protein CBW46_000360 [Paenibacillus xerothermodurans]